MPAIADLCLCFVSRALRSAKRCAAEPGSLRTPYLCAVPALRSGMKNAAPRPGHELFLLQLALRVEVADAAALAAGRGIQHRVDQGRLAGIHRGVHRALEFIGAGRIDAD